MSAILAIARRETAAYFSSPMGWVCLVLFSLLSGLFFTLMVVGYTIQSASMGMMGGEENVTEMLLQGIFGNLSVIVVFIMPALTMGLVAADRREKSLELLLTSPISSTAIAVGKFLGGLAFASLMVATTAYVPASLYWLGEPDHGVMLCNYVGFVALLATFVAVGLFTSSLTDQPVIALVAGVAINLGLWILGWLGSLLGEGKAKAVVEQVSMLEHFENISKGVLHVTDAVYFVSIIVFFVFATTQRIEALRWR
ncbi:MAG: ABC transporter permease subunit [Deltaproteobacteria bacterium]|nr:ABC transporter permease subunit [Deltaproteobacteria bacterium]